MMKRSTYQYPKQLSVAEEHQLIIQAQSDNDRQSKRAKELLIAQYTPFLRRKTKQYSLAARSNEELFESKLQDAYVGFLHSINKFDVANNPEVRLVTYADLHVRNHVSGGVREEDHTPSPAGNSQTYSLKKRIRERFAALKDSGIQDQEAIFAMIAAEIAESSIASISAERVKNLYFHQPFAVISHVVSEDGEELSILETLSAEENEELFGNSKLEFVRAELESFIEKKFARGSGYRGSNKDLWEHVAKRRIIDPIEIGDFPPLDEAAKLFGISRERVRQVEQIMIKHLNSEWKKLNGAC
jgi:DNA-directed RNA polymerase specialized sigma subunit